MEYGHVRQPIYTCYTLGPKARALTHLWHKYERAPLKTKWAQRNGIKWKVKFSVSAGHGLLYVIFFSLHQTFLFTLQILSRILSMNAQLTEMVMFDISTNEIWIFSHSFGEKLLIKFDSAFLLYLIVLFCSLFNIF